MQVVTDLRTIKAICNKYGMEYDKEFKYITKAKSGEFIHKKHIYTAKFVSGCFYPYLFKICDKYKVLTYTVENMGGGTMAIFGTLKNLENNTTAYFCGNEEAIGVYKNDMSKYFLEEEFCDIEDNKLNAIMLENLINEYINGDSKYYDEIINQTNFDRY